jgi:hypothetical protein
VPVWVHELVKALEEEPLVELAGVDSSGPTPRRSLSQRLWHWLDMRLFASSVGRLRRDAPLKARGATLHTRDLRSQGVDVVLWLRDGRPAPDLVEGARCWRWTHPPGGPGPWREVANGDAVSTSILQQLGQSESENEVLDRVAASTDHRSVLRTLAVLRGMEGAATLARLRLLSLGLAHAPASPEPDPASTHPPGPLATFSSFARLVHRFRQDRREASLWRRQWQLAWRHGDRVEDPSALTGVVPPSDRNWADPFPIERDGRHFVFFEEEVVGENGTLAVAELHRGGRFEFLGTAWKRPYHLSWPFLFEHGRELFMIPESGAGQLIEVLRCTEFPVGWEHHTALMRDVRATDPVLFERDGFWWLLATLSGYGNSSSDSLYAFYSSAPFGPWTPHPANPVVGDARYARAAGTPIPRPGGIVRPAQDCSRFYGHAVELRLILRLDPEHYEEVPIRRLEPPEGALAMHTVNRAGGIVWFDRQYLQRTDGDRHAG